MTTTKEKDPGTDPDITEVLMQTDLVAQRLKDKYDEMLKSINAQ